MSDVRTATEATSPPPLSASTARQRSFSSAELLQGAREVLIQHGSEIYRLRLTKAGKLILNK